MSASLKPFKNPVKTQFSFIIFRSATLKVTCRNVLKVMAKCFAALRSRISCCGSLLSLVHIPGDRVNFDENQLSETLKWTPEAWARKLSVLREVFEGFISRDSSQYMTFKVDITLASS